jgi:hypothetical protein
MKTQKIRMALGALALAAAAGTANAGAVVSNGTVSLGVEDYGQLNYGGVGLRYDVTGNDSTVYGCPCEGWGVSNGVVSGHANNSITGPGGSGLTLNSFSSDGTTAVSDVTAAGIFQVVHTYAPSTSANLYAVNVSITNVTGSDQTLLYRRVMDWDIGPTPFSEYVTIVNESPSIVYRTSTNGFASADPMSSDGADGFWYISGPPTGPEITDFGPRDHGALFDFNFGTLAAGATRTFTTFYGAAGSEAEILAALGAVGAENVYSLGQPSNAGGSDPGIPNTFAFAFKGVGAPPVTPIPEPTTLGLLGSGLAALAIARLRRRK